MRQSNISDCVRMKDELQARLAAEYEGLSPEQVRDRRRQILASSGTPLAQKWQRLLSRTALRGS